jgi:hypothetical protein
MVPRAVKGKPFLQNANMEMPSGKHPSGSAGLTSATEKAGGWTSSIEYA